MLHDHIANSRRAKLEQDLARSPKVQEIASKVAVDLPIVPEAAASVAPAKGPAK